MRLASLHPKGGIMKRVLLLMAMLLGGLIAGLVLPAAWRAKLSRSLAAPIGHCLEHVPDG
jgi:hypothetical protein